MERRSLLKVASAAVAAGVLPGALIMPARAAGKIRIGLVAKSLGIGFFTAVDKGAEEAAKSIGDVDIIFTGPTTTTAEGQIQVIQSLIAQHVDAIAVSANDPDALVPVCKRAGERGIKVISYDSAVGTAGRILHLAPSSDTLIGLALNDLAAAPLPDGKGKFAIVSATPTSTNQNAWIAALKADLPKHPGLELITVVYGNDLADDSYREATALLQKYPDMKVIVSPSSVGIVACAKAVEDAKKVGQVYVTGLGLPSECAGHVHSGAIKSFAIWNPIDLGYTAAYLAVDLIKGAKGPGESLPAGRMGTIKVDDAGVAVMAKPFTYDAANVDQFVKVF